ncbi:MAG TPA: DUF2059 domain-containing protein [Candidatus Angelobacter sp.]
MRTLSILFFAFVLLAVAGPVCAQQAAPSPGPAAKARAVQPAVADARPSPDQVLKLLVLLRVRDELQITLDAMKQQVKAGAAQTFSDKVPDPTPAQLKSVNFVVDDVFKDLSLDDLIQDLVPVYQRHLTRSDVRALIAFYSSPPGQKILHEQPAMIKESMQVAGAAQQKRMEVLLAQLEVRMQQLIAQETKAAAEKK